MNKAKKFTLMIFFILFCNVFLLFPACGVGIDGGDSSSHGGSTSSNPSYPHHHSWQTEYAFDEDFHWVSCRSCGEIKKNFHEVFRHEYNE